MKKMCSVCKKSRWMLSFEAECHSCQKERQRAELKEQLTSGEIEETSCEDDVICPWCGEDDQPEVDEDDLWVEGEYERRCGCCDKPYLLETSVSISYSTERKAEEES